MDYYDELYEAETMLETAIDGSEDWYYWDKVVHDMTHPKKTFNPHEDPNSDLYVPERLNDWD